MRNIERWWLSVDYVLLGQGVSCNIPTSGAISGLLDTDLQVAAFLSFVAGIIRRYDAQHVIAFRQL